MITTLRRFLQRISGPCLFGHGEPMSDVGPDGQMRWRCPRCTMVSDVLTEQPPGTPDPVKRLALPPIVKLAAVKKTSDTKLATVTPISERYRA